MKKFIRILLVSFLAATFLVSCKKEANSVKLQPTSSLTVVNGIINSSQLLADFANTHPVSIFYSTTHKIGFSSSFEYSLTSGTVPVTIYQRSDTSHNVYANNVNLKGGGIYSLFLSGSNPSKPDAVFTTDIPPYHNGADSTYGIRFINLTPDSAPVSINLQGKANGSEIGSLAYKAITPFKNYPFSNNVMSITFEVRDAISGVLLTTFVGNPNPFSNNTIVIDGLENDPSGNSMFTFQVNNF